MEPKDTGLGARIKELRKKRFLTIPELAEVLDISPSYVGLLERGDRSPGLSLLIKLSVKLGVSTDYLLFGQEPEDAGDGTLITISENAARGFYPDKGWLDVDKITAFGLAISGVIRKYRFNEKKLSSLYAYVSYMAWMMEARDMP